jgi:hypothetical protein
MEESENGRKGETREMEKGRVRNGSRDGGKERLHPFSV